MENHKYKRITSKFNQYNDQNDRHNLAVLSANISSTGRTNIFDYFRTNNNQTSNFAVAILKRRVNKSNFVSRNQTEAKKNDPYLSRKPASVSTSSSDSQTSIDFEKKARFKSSAMLDKFKKSLPKGKQHYLNKSRYYSP